MPTSACYVCRCFLGWSHSAKSVITQTCQQVARKTLEVVSWWVTQMRRESMAITRDQARWLSSSRCSNSGVSKAIEFWSSVRVNRYVLCIHFVWLGNFQFHQPPYHAEFVLFTWYRSHHCFIGISHWIYMSKYHYHSLGDMWSCPFTWIVNVFSHHCFWNLKHGNLEVVVWATTIQCRICSVQLMPFSPVFHWYITLHLYE